MANNKSAEKRNRQNLERRDRNRAARSAMRTEIKKPMRPTGTKAALKRLEAMGESRAVTALEYTTANEWQGIREPETTRGTNDDPHGNLALLARMEAKYDGK